MRARETNIDASALALQALAWTLGEQDRAERLLALTGLTAEQLRARLGESSLLAAALGFLESHEPDLIACARAIDTTPEALVRARSELEDA
jgi:hypothetical protein